MTNESNERNEAEARLSSLRSELASRKAEREALWDRVKHESKGELLARLSSHLRIHALTERDSKREILYALIDAALPLEALERRIQSAERALARLAK